MRKGFLQRTRFLRWIVREPLFTSFWVLEFSISDNNFIVFNSSNATGNQLDSTRMSSQIDCLKGNITVTLFSVSQSLIKPTNRIKWSIIDERDANDSTIFSIGQKLSEFDIVVNFLRSGRSEASSNKVSKANQFVIRE